MTYDFDEIIDRQNTFTLKHEGMPKGVPADSLPLWVADMDFPCAAPILEALHQRVDRQIFGYTLYEQGEIKAVVKDWFAKRYHWEVDCEDIFFSPGVVPAIAFLTNMLTNEGDGILIQRPVYYPFAGKIEANRRKVVSSALKYTNGRYEMDYDDLDKKLAVPSTKGMILCSPHNPVGRVWTEEELLQVVALCKKHGKWIISDEIHADLLRKGVRHTPIAKLAGDYKDQIITCTAPSKTFNLAGMQLSNIVIHNPEYKALWNSIVADKFSLGLPNPMSVTAMMAAYTHGEEWLEQVNTYIDENIRFCTRFFEEKMPKARVVYPEGTYLLWVDFSAYFDDYKALEDLMLHKAKVALDEGYIFGDEGRLFERINVATPRSILEDCLTRIYNAGSWA